MTYFKRFFGHFNTILTHKRWVFYYASRLGYTWRGLVHDLSKFSPTEFFEGVKYWTGKRSPILVAKEETGISYAWLHHRGRNKHHYEYWIDKLDNGGVPHKMPYVYVVEMVCDWLAASRTYNKTAIDIYKKEYEWWEGRKETANIDSKTKALITKILWNFKEFERSKPDWNEKMILSQIKSFMPYWKRAYNENIREDEEI